MVGILIHKQGSKIYSQETVLSVLPKEPQEEWLNIFTSLIMGTILILFIY